MPPPPRLAIHVGDPAIERTLRRLIGLCGWNETAGPDDKAMTIALIDAGHSQASALLEHCRKQEHCAGAVLLGNASTERQEGLVLPLRLPQRAGELCLAIARFWEKVRMDTPRRIGPSLTYTARNRLLEGERQVELTGKEAELFEALEMAGRLGATREALLEEVWGYAPGLETHTLETHVYRLRQKLEEAGSASLRVEEGRYRLDLPKG